MSGKPHVHDYDLLFRGTSLEYDMICKICGDVCDDVDEAERRTDRSRRRVFLDRAAPYLYLAIVLFVVFLLSRMK